jgi:hypothetical protein
MNLYEKSGPRRPATAIASDRKGKDMIIITILAVTFLVSALAGVLLLVRVGISREERAYYFSSEPQTRITSAARVITGLHVSMPDGAEHADSATTQIDTGQGR